MGCRFSELGLSRGYKVLRITLLWCIMPIIYLSYKLFTGYLSGARLLHLLVSHSLQNGFFEEFLFRGALQTRLKALFNSPWSIVIQAILFGLCHIHWGQLFTNCPDPLDHLASAIVNQGTDGLALGILFARTRNLVACSVFHVLTNSIGTM